MNIFIDCRLCSYGYQGLKTYLEGILPYFLETEHIFFIAGFPEYIDGFTKYKNVRSVIFDAKIHSVKEQFAALRIFNDLKTTIDAYFFPYPSVPFIFWNTSFTVKLHDTTPLKFKRFYNPLKIKVAEYIYKKLGSKAKKIISVSESTKQDLCKLGLNKDKITTIYDGVSDVFKVLSDKEVKEFKLMKRLQKFVLYVGNREPIKNIFRLADAVKYLRQTDGDLDLVVVGRKYAQYSDMDRKLLEYGTWVKIFYDVSTNDLVKYYNSCEVFVHPSLNEGFGLPVAEAMKCGSVMALSDISVFREIAGDAAEYLDPYSVSDIALKIKKMISSSELRNLFSNKALKAANQYSWQRCAEQTLQIISQDLNK